MDGTIVAEEQVSSNEGASTFQAFEGTFLGIYMTGEYDQSNESLRQVIFPVVPGNSIPSSTPPRKDHAKSSTPRHGPKGGECQSVCDLRDLSCLLRCSLLLKARAQKEHLYFFSAVEGFRAGEVGDVSLGEVALPLGGITTRK